MRRMILAAVAMMAAGGAAQAQSVIYDWPISDMTINPGTSSLCTLRIERGYSAMAGAATPNLFAQARNTGTRALDVTMEARYVSATGSTTRQGSFGPVRVQPGTPTPMPTVQLPPGGMVGSKITFTIRRCSQV